MNKTVRVYMSLKAYKTYNLESEKKQTEEAMRTKAINFF